jgi:hypothetical protein
MIWRILVFMLLAHAAWAQQISGGGSSSLVSGTTPLTCTSGTTGVLYQSSGTVACGSALAFNGTTTFTIPAVVQGALASGMNTAASAETIIAPLSTGNATNPNIIFQCGVKTSSGSAQATPTTCLTLFGETLNLTSAGSITAAGNLATGSGNILIFGVRGTLGSTADGNVQISNQAGTNKITIYATPFIVSTLPAGPPTGSTAYVTDAVACTFLGSLTGSGSAFCPVIYNGAAWVAS